MSRRRFPLLAVMAVVALVGIVPASVVASGPIDPYFAAPAMVADLAPITPSSSSNRAYGIAAGDFDEDGDVDLIVGRADGRIFRLLGNGDGTFGVPVVFTWKQTTFNAWAFSTADVNGDANLDIVWGANTLTTGCSVSPIPVGLTCATAGGQTVTVNDGEVRVFLGNGNGTFVENVYFVGGVRHNAGTLIADIGTDAGTVVTGDIDGDSDIDIVAGAIDGANATVKLLRNSGGGVFAAPAAIVSQAAGGGSASGPVYWAIITGAATVSPWGLALADADGDGDLDLWLGDRALYVYLYRNGGTGSFALVAPNTGLPSGRENAFIDHDSYRLATGFTPALAAADINLDGRADLAVGLHSGGQTTNAGANDGTILIDASSASSLGTAAQLPDLGAAARSVVFTDVNGDGSLDIVSGTAEGKVWLLRQLPPIDSDGDGISDYVDNAPAQANAPRIDMNTDGSTNYRDQLDNDFDTVLGDPENQASWTRLGDAADTDDDNDGAADGADNCSFTANGGQADGDGDGMGDACDPLDDTDTDGDGVPDGPLPTDAGYEPARDAAILWSQGDTHFVIRIDALGRFFQNEFTGLMADAAISSAADWAAKCQGMYNAGDPDPGCATLPGGIGVPVTTVVIPRLLWSDPEVIDWINDRNDNPLFEIGQHGTYHFSNTLLGDWASDSNKNFFSCEFCGLTDGENYELMRVGYDTLMGNYANVWVAQGGALPGSPKIDWNSSAHPLLSYSPPFNADDPAGRAAVAALGFIAFSSSIFEEGEAGGIGQYFTPEGSHHEAFDQYGVFHASADLELEPPVTASGAYDPQTYADYLADNTQPGGLNTWLIEEVEWSGRPCNDLDRLADLCSGASNRENNTVYRPRWDGWIQLLEYVRDYPGGVAMTMGQVALAKAYDNAPTVANADQADTDHDGIGDVIDDATLVVNGGSLSRNQPGSLSATLESADGSPLQGQLVTFEFDYDGNGVAEQYPATTDPNGVATASVTATRPVGPAAVSASWDGLRATAAGNGSVGVVDAASLELDANNPSAGQITDQVTVAATLTDSDGAPIVGRTVDFTIGTATAAGSTDANGRAEATLTLTSGATTLVASFDGDALYGPASDSAPFEVQKESTALVLQDAVASKNGQAVARATLTEADGAPLAGRTVQFLIEQKVRGKATWQLIGSATTDAAGVATFTVPKNNVSTQPKPLRAQFLGDSSFLASSDDASVYRR